MKKHTLNIGVDNMNRHKPRTKAMVRNEISDTNIRINKHLDKVSALKVKRQRLFDEIDNMK